MKQGRRKLAAIAGSATVVAMLAASTMSAGAAAVPGSVSFANADFHGYASGEELNLGALSVGSNNVAGVEEAYSSASANTAGLATPIVGDSRGGSLLDQPSEAASNKAYASGAGLEAGLVAPSNASGDQLKLSGLAKQVAPPNNSEVTDSLPSPPLNLSTIATKTGLLEGRAAAIYDSETCPLGQPISYGLGNAAATDLVGLSSLSGVTGALSSLGSALNPLLGVLSSVGGVKVGGATDAGNLVTNNGDTESTSSTYLSANGDGTFGLTTQETVDVAPITINLLGIAQVDIIVGGNISGASAGSYQPITLTATATGEGSGAKINLAADDDLAVDLVVAGQTVQLVKPISINTVIGEGGLAVPLSLQGLTSALETAVNDITSATTLTNILNSSALGGLLSQLGVTGLVSNLLGSNPTVAQLKSELDSVITGAVKSLPSLSLGELDLGTPVRAINGAATSSPTPGTVGTASSSEGTQASGAFDLVRAQIGGAGTLLSSLNVLDLNLLHMEAAANLQAPITCTIPVVKTSNPTAVKAGDNFAYTIDIPTPSQIPYLDCNLTGIKATDTISDAQGSPSFSVVSATDGGSVTQSSPNSATINWSGLTYNVAPVGQAPNPPIQLVIQVHTPSNSTTGVIQDLVTATGTLGNCNGGASGVTDLGGATGTSLTGQYSLTQPSVTAVPVTPATKVVPSSQSAAAPGAPAASLPKTGGTGGPWQPAFGLLALGLGGGSLALVRRSRRGFLKG